MTTLNEDYAVARFAQLSDEDLMAVVGKDREDYTERAIELAQFEMRRRGIESTDVNTSAAAPGMPVGRHRAPLGVRWLGLYTALVGASAVGGPIAQLVMGSPPSWIITVQLPLSALQGAVAYGLLRRRSWGWYLNWVLLLVVIAVPTSHGSGPGALAYVVWIVLNVIYFAKRRSLFMTVGRDRLSPST